ncbi:hypothetical protein [Pseudoalteromonas luteoviolacea]|uniref:hypothetical protein n=1 Tax=Pseudoalteromonas luteoviolacea TaxID=43657 RepID=UPI001B3763EE|nr:hypothetical protein [Pseudoalteromonas luteoviolacea]MBQ4836807.1 hypothetical protein [Pseudoalteromonas luteoviolacea]
MINIMRHLNNKVKSPSGVIDECVDMLWKYVNKTKKDGSPCKNSITSKLSEFKLKRLRNGSTSTDKDRKKRQESYLRWLKKSGQVERLIRAKPADFEKINNEVEAIIKLSDITDKDSSGKSLSDLLLASVFRYDLYRSHQTFIDIYKELHFHKASCVYCNIHSIGIVKTTDKKEKSNFDIDHFYCKSQYPHFALSFFNHIPSCKECNQTYKGKNNFTTNTHIHPFLDCFDSHYRFTTLPGSLQNGRVSSISLDIETNKYDEIKDDLNLEFRYKNEIKGDLISEFSEYLWKRRKLFTKGKPEEIQELKEYIESQTCLNKEDILRTRMSKLKRDIVKEYNIRDLAIFD